MQLAPGRGVSAVHDLEGGPEVLVDHEVDKVEGEDVALLRVEPLPARPEHIKFSFVSLRAKTNGTEFKILSSRKV